MDVGTDYVSTRFYRESEVSTPVDDWFKSFKKRERKLISSELKTIQACLGRGIYIDSYESIGNEGLYLGSTKLPSKRKAYFIFCCYGNLIMVLHGFDVDAGRRKPVLEAELEISRKRYRRLYAAADYETRERDRR